MKKSSGFKVGDKVFAKIKGYPPWPARIETGKVSKKYTVKFYGTGEIGKIKAEDLFYYLKHKDSLVRTLKRKDYNDALDDIEKAIKKDGGDGDDGIEHDESLLNESTEAEKKEPKQGGKRKRSTSDSGKKKPVKRAENEENTDSEVGGDVSDESTVEKKVKKPAAKVRKVSEAVEEPKEPEDFSKFAVFAETDLKHFVLYGEYVEKDAEYFKKRKVEEPTIDYNSSLHPVRFHGGEWGGIRLTLLPSPKISSEFDRAVFEKTLAAAILEKKPSLEKEGAEIEQEHIIPNIGLSEEQFKEKLSARDLEEKQNRVQRLKDEARLLALDRNIKMSLGLDSADPKAALELLKEMHQLDKIDHVMLLKHPHVLEMVKKLKTYIGNTKAWDMNENALQTFNEDAQLVREKAELVYNSFKTKFPFNGEKENINFGERVAAAVRQFKEEVKDLSETEICLLIAQPRSRATFLAGLKDRENKGTEEVAAEAHPVEEEASKEGEKENSSKAANGKAAEGEPNQED